MADPLKEVRLVITLKEDGTVDVNGPLSQKLQCYGMLECAKEAIRAWNEQQDRQAAVARRIVAPPLNGGVPK